MPGAVTVFLPVAVTVSGITVDVSEIAVQLPAGAQYVHDLDRAAAPRTPHHPVEPARAPAPHTLQEAP